jgi:thiol:disulfide interchange protein DsbC
MRRNQKRHFFTTPAVALLTATLLVSVAELAVAADDKLEAVRAKVSATFEQIGPENVNYSPIDGWYTVQKGSIVAYISDDGKYLMQGDLIDLDANVNLTERSRDAARRSLVAGITDDQVITFSPAEVKHSVTIFTDTDCTYCRRLHSQIDEYMAAGIEVRYILYPRNGPASPAWGKAEEVWCSSDRNKALTAAKLDRNFQTSECDASNVQRSYVLGQDVGLSGTPAIVLEDGTLIGGYMPPQALSQALSGMASVD